MGVQAKSGRRIDLPGGVNDWAGFVPAVALVIALVVIDIRAGTSVVLIGAFAAAPFLTALRGGWKAAVAVSVLVVCLAAASGSWNHNFGSTDYLIRMSLLIGASIYACYSGWLIAESRRASRRLGLLNEVGAVADGATPVSPTLERITQLCVPELADLCMIDVITDDRVERVAVRASEPRRAEIEPRIAAREPSLPLHILEGGGELLEPHFIENMREADLQALAHSPEDLEFLSSMEVRSYMTLGLSSRGRRIGALTLVDAWSGRRHSREDVRFARVLADRIAVALDNAGLFTDLESVERRMDTVMAVLDEAVGIIDRNGELIFANQAAVELGGHGSLEEMMEAARSGEIRNHIFDEQGEPLDRREMAPQRALRGEEVGPQIIRLVNAESGKETWVRIRSRAVRGPDGRPIYAVSVFEDVTDIKLAEFAQSVLAKTGELLATSTDFEAMLQQLVVLLIPQLADCCTVHLPAERHPGAGRPGPPGPRPCRADPRPGFRLPDRAGRRGGAADDLPHRGGARRRRPRAADRRRGAGRSPGRAIAEARGRLGDDPAADGRVKGDRDAQLRQPVRSAAIRRARPGDRRAYRRADRAGAGVRKGRERAQ